MAHTVIAGVDKHMLYRQHLLKQWRKDDLNGVGNRLGTYINERIYMEYILGQQAKIIQTGENTYKTLNNLNIYSEQQKTLLQEQISLGTKTILHIIDKVKKSIKNPLTF